MQKPWNWKFISFPYLCYFLRIVKFLEQNDYSSFYDFNFGFYRLIFLHSVNVCWFATVGKQFFFYGWWIKCDDRYEIIFFTASEQRDEASRTSLRPLWNYYELEISLRNLPFFVYKIENGTTNWDVRILRVRKLFVAWQKQRDPNGSVENFSNKNFRWLVIFRK